MFPGNADSRNRGFQGHVFARPALWGWGMRGRLSGGCFFQLMASDSILTRCRAPEQAELSIFHLFGKPGAGGEKAEGVRTGKESVHVLSGLQPSSKVRFSPGLHRPLFFGNYNELRVIISSGSSLEGAFAIPPSLCPSPPQTASSRDISSPTSSSGISPDHLFHSRL